MNCKGFSSVELLIVIVWIVGIGGWIANIVKLVGMLGGEITAMFIARCVGVFVAPLGVILGFL